MKENTNQNNEMAQIDLMRIGKAVWKRAWLICLSAVAGAVAALLITIYMITPMYNSSALFYVNNGSVSVGDAALSISSSSLSAAQKLVDTYIVILKSRACLNDVIDYAGLDRSYDELVGMISAESVNSTEVFKVVVTSPDPAEAKTIANAVAYILPKQISTIIEGSSAKIVDYAVVPSSPSSPNVRRNAVLGFLAGALLMGAIVVVWEIFNTTVRSEEDITQCSAYPVLAAVPNMNAHSGGARTARSRSRGAHAKKKGNSSEEGLLLGNVSFAASEAYKLLRTKLQFSFVDEITCPVIGVSSALAGEGKSLSSVNLAFSLAQLDKKVLLVECDLRQPTIAEKLSVRKTPGLSDYLTGQSELEDIFQLGKIGEENPVHVITSGRVPPNPIELLSATKMSKMIGALREAYDYIILDLPPVGEVSDAIVASKMTDGVLLVVRQDYCNTVALRNAIGQFEFVGSKILGTVFNFSREQKNAYGYYSRRYRYKYAYPQSQERAGDQDPSDQS